MRHFKSNWQRYSYAGFLIIASFVGAWLGSYQGDPILLRSGVFFLVAAVLLAELLTIVGRTPEGRWDGLNISMAFFRLSVVNYIASLAIEFTGLVSYPESWWTSSRTVMGLFAAIALFFMVQEDYSAWQVMTKKQRTRAVVVPIFYVICIIGVAFVW